MRLHPAVWCAFLAVATTSTASALPLILITRHAEKVDDAPDARLSAKGLERAEALARRLRDAKVTHIYATQVERTQQTAAPLARNLKLTPTILKAEETQTTLVQRLKKHGDADVVLVVNHSDRMGGLWTALGCSGTVEVTSKDFDQLLVVVPNGKAAPTCTQLRVDGN